MKVGISGLKRCLAVFMLIALVCSSSKLPVVLASTRETTNADNTDLSENPGSISDGNQNENPHTGESQEQDGEVPQDIIVEEEYYDMGEAQTSAVSMSFFSLANGTVEATGTNEVAWIDRIVLEDKIRALYDKLVEGSDNDGVDDILIDDSYFTGTHSILVAEETVLLNGQTVDDVIADVWSRYLPFVNAVCSAFDRDHPEVFWLSGHWTSGISCSYNSTQCTVTVYITLQNPEQDDNQSTDVRAAGYQSETAIKDAIAERDAAVNAILTESNKKSTVYDKIAYFNDRLTTTNEYNTSSDLNNIANNCRECISALKGSSGTAGPVCEGYARAFKVLCDAAGIPCVLVDGYVDNGSEETEAHMWNYVQVDGAWYAVDVTWNDPVGGNSGIVSGFESKDWLLVGSETVINGKEFLVSHPVSNKVFSDTIAHAFTNGPLLSTGKYVPAVATTLSVNTYSGSTEKSDFTYGDTITIQARATANNVTATTQAIELYYGTEKLEGDGISVSNADSNGLYTITYDTTSRKIPAGDQTLTVRFAGGEGTGEAVMSAAEQSFRIILNPATPTIQFGSTTGKTTYTGKEAQITSPVVTLVSNETFTETESWKIAYAYKEQGSAGDYTNGLPVNAGTYIVKASLGASADGYYSKAESINELTLTIDKVTPVFNISSEYKVNKEYDGRAISVPTEDEVTFEDGIGIYSDMEFRWYKGSVSEENILTSAPVDAGTYRLRIYIPEMENLNETGTELDLKISPKTLEITATAQSITYGEEIVNNISKVVASGLADGDTLTSINLTSSTTSVTENGTITPGNAVVLCGERDVTDNYDISYKEGKLEVGERSLADAVVKLNIPAEGLIYNKTAQVPNVTVTVKGTTLLCGTDYEVKYSNNVNAGTDTAVVTVTGKGNYAGTVEKKFTINKKKLSGSDITVGNTEKVYDGTATANLSVKVAEGAVMDGDTIIISGASGTYDSVNAGNRTIRNIVSGEISGTGVENYEIIIPTEVSGTISRRAVTVTADAKSKEYGEQDPELTYTIDLNTPLVENENLVGAVAKENGEDAKVYKIQQNTLTNDNNPNYDITFYPADFTISKVAYKANVSAEQIVVQGVGTFAEPAFITQNDKKETVTGTLTYEYGSETGLTYETLVNRLKTLQADAECTITYTFTPDNANYTGDTTGSIQLTVKDVEFTVADSQATTANAVTIKAAPTYGDTWAEIITLNTITASVGNEKDSTASHFTLDVSGSPAAGVQTFHVYYNGTISGKTFSNVLVCTGTVDVARKTVAVTAGDYRVSKVYDGTTDAGVASGSLAVEGILSKDTDVTVKAVPIPYNDANVGGQTGMTVDLTLNGTQKDNYQLEKNQVPVPCEITRRPVTVQANNGSKTYGEKDPAWTYSFTEGTSTAAGESLVGNLARETGDNVGSYQITQGDVTADKNPNYDITFLPGTFTINAAGYTVQVSESQIIVKDVCDFVQPAFTGVNSETVSGTLTYGFEEREGLSYEAMVELLKQFSAEEEITIQYRFIPSVGGNYVGEKAGSIAFLVKTVEFYAGSEKAEVSNTVIVKETPVYGDDWTDILQLRAGLSAQLVAETDADQSHFTLDVSGVPNAGQQSFNVYYSGTLGGVAYTNVLVCSGTVNIDQKDVTAGAGTYKASKVYDGTVAAGTATGAVELTGVLNKDTDVTVSVKPGDYASEEVGSGTMNVTISLSGTGKENYRLTDSNLTVPCEITPKALTVNIGTYKVSKIYDGTLTAGAATGALELTGVIVGDTDVIVAAQIPDYTDANAGGQTTMEVGLSLSGSQSANYRLSKTSVTVPCEIVPKTVTPVITVAGTYSYTGSIIAPAFSVECEDGLLSAADYAAVFSDNLNAGTGKILLTAVEGSNYIWKGTVQQTFEIGKITYTGAKSGAVSVMYGNKGTFDLSALLPDGAKLGQLSTADDDSILSGAAAVNGAVLCWNVVDNAQKVGKTAVISVPVTEATNYLPYDVTVTVTVSEKQTQKDFCFKDSVIRKTYGDSDFTVTAIGATEGSTVTYTSSDAGIATVDGSGKVQILKAGTAVITAAASETAAYGSATTSYTLYVDRKALTWDTAKLSALDREDNVANKKATLTGALGVNGVLDEDKQDVTFNCPADKLTGIYAAVTPGTQEITLSWADTSQPVVLQGNKGGNYLLPATLPQITGIINEVKEDLIVPPESTDSVQYKLTMEKGISQVPNALKNDEKWNTPDKIVTEMKLSVQKISGDILIENTEIYNVELLINVNGQGWIKATEENFPQNGLTATLPYPSGAGKDTHDFTVVHLFAADVNGHKAGDLEYPDVIKTDAGIQFRVYGLSPISIGWKEVTKAEEQPGDSTTDESQSSPDESTSSDTPVVEQTSTSTSVAAAPTGDTGSVSMYVLMLVLAGICIVVVKKRRQAALH